MEQDPHSAITHAQHKEAEAYQLATGRAARWNGWRSWTIVLAVAGFGFTAWALARANTIQDIHRIITTLASICGGGAFVTGFLWKLLGENSLTVIKMKDELIAELRRTHEHDIGAMQKDISLLKEELSQLKELNLALQRYNLDLTGERDDLLTLRDSLERNLATVTQEKAVCEAKAGQLTEMLALAERKITLLQSDKSPSPSHT